MERQSEERSVSPARQIFGIWRKKLCTMHQKKDMKTWPTTVAATAVRLGKGIIAFSPLAQGLLTNRYLNGIPEDSRIMTDGRFLKKEALTEELRWKILLPVPMDRELLQFFLNLSLYLTLTQRKHLSLTSERLL